MVLVLRAADLLQAQLAAGVSLQAALTSAHVACNAALAAESMIDDSQSGTTAISVLFEARASEERV